MVVCAKRFSNETIPSCRFCDVRGSNTSVWVVGNCNNIRYPPPPLNASLNSRTLDLRETASQLVVETIENVLRAGGIALFDERFQIDSSLDWVLGEAVGGELEAVVPLWSKDGHVVFAQPGFVLWNGLADDDRLDGNLGVVYRTNLLNTPIGFDAIGGVSLFYDHDFQIGHSRLGIGVDVQRDGFHGAFNYYHPLSDTQDGREGYVEDALQGMDARFAVESDVTRVGGSVGYWLFQGDKDEWEFSYGLDAGLRLMPGVFLEGRLERHDKKASFGRRASVGLAFRFTLPNFDGKSYGEGGRVSNLWSPVDRESRILYEERESGPKVSVVRSNSNEIVTEGGTITATIRLDEAFEENVTLNLIGSGTATYNDDYTVSVGGSVCPMVTEDNCQITIVAGQTDANAVVTINNDGRGESAETIILSTAIADAGNTGLSSGRALVINIPADPPLPTVSLSASSVEITEGGMATLMLTLNEMLEADATFNLIGSGGAGYGTDADWNLNVGGTDCDMATRSSPCQVTIDADDTTAEVIVEVNTDTANETTLETFTVSVEVDSGSTSIVQEGSRSSLNFTIPADPPLPTVSLSADKMSIAEGETATITLTLSEALGRQSAFTLTGSTDDSVVYGSSGDYRFTQSGVDCSRACTVTIPANQSSFEVTVSVNADSMNETVAETFSASLTVNQASQNIVQLGSPSMLNFTIPAEDPLPTVSWIADATSITEGNTATITFTLSESLGGNATFNLSSFSVDRAATYGTDADWNLSVGGTDCDTATFGNPCKVTIMQGDTTAEVIVKANTDMNLEQTESVTITVEIDSGSRSIVALGSSGTLRFTIQDDPPPTASLNYNGSGTTVSRASTGLSPVRFTVVLSETLSQAVTLNLIGDSRLVYGELSGWYLYYRVAPAGEGSFPDSLFEAPIPPRRCTSVASAGDCQVEIPANATLVDVQLFVSGNAGDTPSGSTITVSLGIPMASENLVVLGTSSTHTLTITD